MAELKITAANFENEVLHSDKPVLLDFYADWCGPCKMLSPVLHELAEEKSGTLKVGKVNVDEQMELAMRFQVSSIPMLVVFKDGKAVAKSVGYRPKAEIAAMVEDDILRGVYGEEEQVPSTNDLARAYNINPATAAKGISLLLCDPLSERRHQRRWCVVKIFNYGAKPHRLMAYLSDKHCLIRWCCNAEFLHRRINVRKPARSQPGANTSRLLK